MTDQDARPEVAAEAALQAAAESLKEQLAALDESIAYHEARAAELKETRRKVTRVEAIVSGPGPSKPGRKPGTGKTRMAEVMTKRHAAENVAKRNRVHEYVLGVGRGVDIRAHELRPALNANGEQPIGDAFLKSILSELRDAGVLRLDRREAGGAAVYRLAVRGD